MISALISFFGGTAFRMIWGEVSHWLTQQQDHKHELERLKVQGELDAAQHARNLEALRLQSELGVKTIQAQADADLSRIDASAWAQAVADVGKSTGIKFVDTWNGIIRPWLATMAGIMVVVEFVHSGFVMSAFISELVGAILGIFVADRSLKNRGK